MSSLISSGPFITHLSVLLFLASLYILENLVISNLPIIPSLWGQGSCLIYFSVLISQHCAPLKRLAIRFITNFFLLFLNLSSFQEITLNFSLSKLLLLLSLQIQTLPTRGQIRQDTKLHTLLPSQCAFQFHYSHVPVHQKTATVFA